MANNYHRHSRGGCHFPKPLLYYTDNLGAAGFPFLLGILRRSIACSCHEIAKCSNPFRHRSPAMSTVGLLNSGRVLTGIGICWRLSIVVNHYFRVSCSHPISKGGANLKGLQVKRYHDALMSQFLSLHKCRARDVMCAYSDSCKQPHQGRVREMDLKIQRLWLIACA